MRIVVLDGYTLNPGDNPWDEIAALGELTVYDRTPPEQVVERAAGATIVLTNKTRLPGDTLAQLADLRFIAVLATGYDIVDIAAARRQGIAVANVPEYGTDSVAQHVVALLLELCQRVGAHDTAVHAGAWQHAPDFAFVLQPPIELAGLTMGLVGYGRIGQRVAQLARAFGMEIVASETTRAENTVAVRRASLPSLFAHSDVVSLHCPLNAENARFVDAALLSSMKPSALFINTARGGLVDETALANALRHGVIAGAAVDVVSSEPMRADNPLLGAPNCIITPHMAWASLAARRRLMATAAANVRAFLGGASVNRV